MAFSNKVIPIEKTFAHYHSAHFAVDTLHHNEMLEEVYNKTYYSIHV